MYFIALFIVATMAVSTPFYIGPVRRFFSFSPAAAFPFFSFTFPFLTALL